MDGANPRAEAVAREQEQDLAVAARAGLALADEIDVELSAQSGEPLEMGPAFGRKIEAPLVARPDEALRMARRPLVALEVLEQLPRRREGREILIAQLFAQSAGVEAHRHGDMAVRARERAAAELGDGGLLEHGLRIPGRSERRQRARVRAS
jgi:hypothetical protein